MMNKKALLIYVERRMEELTSILILIKHQISPKNNQKKAIYYLYQNISRLNYLGETS